MCLTSKKAHLGESLTRTGPVCTGGNDSSGIHLVPICPPLHLKEQTTVNEAQNKHLTTASSLDIPHSDLCVPRHVYWRRTPQGKERSHLHVTRTHQSTGLYADYLRLTGYQLAIVRSFVAGPFLESDLGKRFYTRIPTAYAQSHTSRLLDARGAYTTETFRVGILFLPLFWAS
ncbi:hypothetical protein K504DRAFT_12653 [Pleomassaria siparia CBS 279.74]|uniref:Uncharacterized protein n=1 Tax=Pleomassaria siparia CBS 279.74 TaxID=1314801 RepID=A0A6G1KPU8_9PLEO|nr:hypothetical protein K504DRAFT_12653 [Pleomassaria siparia CBS 279.74]